DAKELAETDRMLSLAVAALFEIGVTNPRNHIFVATQGAIATLILSRTPFTPTDLGALNDAAKYYEHDILVSPAIAGASQTLNTIVAARDREDLQRRISNPSFDLSPATDDRPFFFNQLPLTKPAQAFYLAKELIGADIYLGGIISGNVVAT